MGVLNLVGTVKIITKAGYSGWWILVPFGPVVQTFATSVVGSHAVVSGITTRSFDFAPTGALALIDLSSVILSEVVFLIFAFRQWPVLRGPSRSVMAWERSRDQFLPLPTRAQDPGWYQVGVTNNDQGYWDGQSWTARRRWDGAGWSEVVAGSSEQTS